MSPRRAAPDLAEARRDHATDEFAREVHRALSHLHDLAYLQTLSLQPLDPVARSARSSLHAPSLGRTLRQSLLESIDALGSMPPRSTHSSRLNDLVRFRYVDGLEINTVCDRLGISRSEYFRDHRRALAAVCSILGDSWRLGRAGAREDQPSRGALWTAAKGLREPSRTLATNVPTLLTSFVGREREMAEVRSLLGQTRLLTLTGTGGCGKTRLAVEVARSLLDTCPVPYPDGVWLVQLAPIADPDLVPLTLATSLGLRDVAGESMGATLIRRLGSRHTLLLLDNCEHLIDGCARVTEALLESCPDLSILATSRQPLGIGGEVTLYVPSLDSPPAEGWVTRESLLQAVLSHDATRLFLDRASAALPAFAASTSNASAIAEICRRLDGIPLAIELAAARVRALSPEQIASRLDHDFHLLTGGSRTALPRQQTLKATLDWSHDLLAEQEAQLLRRLSVFAGGFTLVAAEGVCTGDGTEELEVVNLLAQLVDKSLVEMSSREGDARYRLLEPVRQYAWHRLEESGETDRLRRRHAEWLAEYVRREEDEVHGPREASWLRRVAPENDNVRAALDWCLDQDPRLGMMLASNMYAYWLTRGVKTERSRWLDELLARDPKPSAVRFGVLGEATCEAFHEGDYELATALASEHLSLCLQYAESEAGWPLDALAALAAEQGDQERARALLDRAEAIARKHGNAATLAQSLVWGGYAAWLAGNYREARRLAGEGLATCPAGAHAYVGLGHFIQGIAATSMGGYEAARGELTIALHTLRGILQALDMSRCHAALGYVSLREGDFEGARRSLSEALRLVPREFTARISPYLTYAALLASREGDASRAVRLAAAAEGIHPYARNLIAPDQRADLDACLAEARAALGEAGWARACAEGQAMTLDEAVEYALGE